VPTAAPAILPKSSSVVTVSARLSAARVHRGHAVTLTVEAEAGDPVTATIRYAHHGRSTFKGSTGTDGAYVHAWTVPGETSPGPASMVVTIKRSPQPFTVKFSLVVTK
jgi:hypothetical protein